MDKFVDVRRIIAGRNKNLLRWIPGFVIRWLERVIHQDDVNEFMVRHKHDDAYAFCEAALKNFRITVTASGLENVPAQSTPCIFVANHPLGGFDAIAIIHLLRDKRPDIKFIVNDLLMNVKNLQGQFVGVNKVGKTANESLQRVEEQFASGSATFLFPAGLVSRKINGQIKDLEWKKTFITKAIKYNKLVVPVYIDGRLTNRFYRLANLRKFLGIKFNFEMLFLVDELFKQKGIAMHVVFGKPVPAETFTREKSQHAWAQWMKEAVYRLNES